MFGFGKGEPVKAHGTETVVTVAKNPPLTWRTEKRRIGDLVEWDHNPRRLTEKQAADLAASLAKFGYVEEIVVNADGKSMIGGHQRRRVLLAQALLDPDALVDVRIPSRSLNEQEGIELAIRLNRNTGEWDWEMLANDFDEDALKDFGFTDFDFDKMGGFGGEGDAPTQDSPEGVSAEPAEWKTPEGPFDVREAGKEFEQLLPEPTRVEDLVPYAITVPGARMAFNRLCGGESGHVGGRISLLFNPHRLAVAANKDRPGPIPGMTRPDVRAIMALWLAKRGASTAKEFFRDLNTGFGGMRLVNEFPPALARDIWRELLGDKKGVRVLDPCHGWGGRLIGFMALQVDGLYVGVDPSTRTSKGVEKLFHFLKGSGVPGRAELHCQPFEEFDAGERLYDAILTSPPYFDSELYAPDEKTQSAVRYPTLDQWVAGFLQPLVEKCLKALKPDGVCALNVGNEQYRLGDEVARIATEAGARVERRALRIGGGRGVLNSDDKSSEANDEDLLVIRR